MTRSGKKEKRPSLYQKTRPFERIIEILLLMITSFSILVTAGIVIILGRESFRFFTGDDVALVDFLTSREWQPVISKFGILPLLNATILTSVMAMVLAMPLGIFIAVYLSEYAGKRIKSFLKPALEVLAGIPTIVYGYFALTVITPVLRYLFGEGKVQIYNTASAGIAIGILILPLIASMSEDALASIPGHLREAGTGLGATKLEVTLGIVIPSAFSGLAAAFIVGISRAVGETMIVALAAGARSNLTLNPLESAETMTGYIVRISGGDVGFDTLDYNSIFAIGMVLFLMTFVLNHLSRHIVKKYREIYE